MTRLSFLFLFNVIAMSFLIGVPSSSSSSSSPNNPQRGSNTNRSQGRGNNDANGMPSLFASDERQYDKYAACLAATEGLRRIRDREFYSVGKKNNNKEQQEEAQQLITAKYLLNSGRVLHAMGMTASKFNELGREISSDPNLKDKVMEQAYLYRMGASITSVEDEMPVIEDIASQRRRAGKRSTTSTTEQNDNNKVKMFCETVSEIETLRSNQVERLKKALSVDKFPSNVSISDPGLIPFLNPKVRAVVEAFPLQAEHIVKKNGLNAEEFNFMLRESKSNPKFRREVSTYVSKIKDINSSGK